MSFNKVRRKIYGPKWDKVRRQWRRLPNDELYDLYCSPSITQRRTVMHWACMGNRKGAYRVLVRRPKGKRQLGKPRHTWEDNNKMYLLESGPGSVVGIATG